MKDLVLKGFVNSFADSKGYPNSTSADVFEAFASNAVLRKYHSCDVTEIEEFLTGGGNDGGLDCIAILVNGRPVKSKEDLEFFRQRIRRLEFEFVFVQAKTSASFDASGIGTFVHGVTEFFSENARIRFSQEIEALRVIKDAVYDLSIAMDQNPTCSMYYATAGRWNNDPEPSARIDAGVRQLESTHLFSEVKCVPVDASHLKSIYRELERGVTREIELTKTATFPAIDGVAEAYLGLLRGNEFLRLIESDEGDLNRELFYDNVRDYQGRNPVNNEIAATVSGDRNTRFPLLNNGITIVARSVSRTGDRFQISDFQIVNGCQTTHVLYQNRDSISADTFVPIKLVITDDSEIISEVIKATNWQTAVMPEALESLTPFHKEVEDFYNGYQVGVDRDNRIYYERRSKQYYFDPVPESNVVTLTAQTKSFVAMFLNEPHSYPRYYGELLKAYETRLFVSDHKPAPYFAAGLAYVLVSGLFNRKVLPKRRKTYIYHVLMLVRSLLAAGPTPRFNSHQATTYSEGLISGLQDADRLEEACREAIQLIEGELKNFEVDSGGNPPSRLKAFTEALLSRLRQRNGVRQSAEETEPKTSDEPVLGSEETGSLLWFDEVKGFGFIARDEGGDIFVHVSGLANVPWNHRDKGARYRYEVTEGPKSLTAKVLEVLV